MIEVLLIDPLIYKFKVQFCDLTKYLHEQFQLHSLSHFFFVKIQKVNNNKNEINIEILDTSNDDLSSELTLKKTSTP